MAIVGLVNWWMFRYKFAIRPEEKPGLEGFLTFLWNKETGEVIVTHIMIVMLANSQKSSTMSWVMRFQKQKSMRAHHHHHHHYICTSSDITRPSDRQIISKTNTSAIINIMSKCKTQFIWIVVNSIEIDSIPARICHHSLPQVMGRTGMSWRKYFSLRI